MIEQSVSRKSISRITIEQLEKLHPMSTMDPAALRQLLAIAELHKTNEKSLLFRKGSDNRSIMFLIEGELALIDDKKNVKKIQANTPNAAVSIDDAYPHQYSAMSLSKVRYILINRKEFDRIASSDASSTKPYIVQELNNKPAHSGADWMTTLLHSKLYEKIPPSNIQTLFMSLESRTVTKGEVIINEGDQADYYFIIAKGEAEIKRKLPKSERLVRVGKVGIGKSFGEEGLLSDAPRNATVVMLTDGVLKILSKKEFKRLLQQAIIKNVDFNHAKEIITSGGQWLDVRLESEHANTPLSPCINIPLYRLRESTSLLDKNTQYVIICDTGKRSHSALFLLSELGYNAVMLEKGINHYPSQFSTS
ncbi:cyclic nucleotide-binding domain-containing protein [Pelagibaculum spongiae]|uniref:Cyclic nucleotide-binding protein n=1 Tax=Pelagibaculum spongiae TaxID=2080658 RepID=A0A2V1GUW1_9GAMM|nr:cyclic nucleotide-binding domain-containing protein [Pelagibaculum spongiae]PVZ62973.1 hypothetical protein DC094_21645 [Pelagibaculum spongiae]